MTDAVLQRMPDADHLLIWWCPGCECAHHLDTDRWQWNGDLVKPTASPSFLIHLGDDRRCHSFMRDGALQLLDDCTHGLAGRTVPMVPWSEVD